MKVKIELNGGRLKVEHPFKGEVATTFEGIIADFVKLQLNIEGRIEKIDIEELIDTIESIENGIKYLKDNRIFDAMEVIDGFIEHLNKLNEGDENADIERK